MIEPQINTIDGVTYHFFPLGAKASRAIYPRIMLEASKLWLTTLGQVQALTLVDPNFVQLLHDTFAPQCQADFGKGPVALQPLAEAHFGRMGAVHEMKWLRWMLECQYPDFLAEFKKRVAEAVAKAEAFGGATDSAKGTM